MLVLERTERIKSKDEEFPPLNSIDFYEILWLNHLDLLYGLFY
jgi:hypothetical protein